jgi:hypothetical protein
MSYAINRTKSIKPSSQIQTGMAFRGKVNKILSLGKRLVNYGNICGNILSSCEPKLKRATGVRGYFFI